MQSELGVSTLVNVSQVTVTKCLGVGSLDVLR